MPRIGIDARKIGDGGIGRYLRELLARVAEQKPSAEWLAFVHPGAVSRVAELAPQVRAVPVRAGGYSLAEHVELGRAAARERLDLLHVPHYVVPAVSRCPLVVTVHDVIHLKLPRSPWHAPYARAMLGLARRRARLALVPAAAVARDLIELAHFAPERVRVVPNGVSAEFLERGPPSAAAVETFVERRGLRRPYVLNVTNGLPHKGLDVLLAALAPLGEVQLAVVGEDLDRRPVREQLRRARLAGPPPAILAGLDDAELRLAYAGAAAVVVASRLEGFGLPALEALAVGGLVIATEAGGLPEAVGDAALLVPPGSVDCLARALYRATNDMPQAEREALARRGVARARGFPWGQSVSATCAAYEQALAGSG